MGGNIIEINKIYKNYGKKKALIDINLNIKQGEIYGIIGKNGAGKTTLLKILASLLLPSSGVVNIDCDGGNSISSLIERPGIYENESARRNLFYKGKVLKMTNINEEIDRVLNLVGLSSVADLKVRKYSLGMKQRLGIALAIFGNPKIVLLDEPINGLDPQSIIEIRELIIFLNKKYNTTFLISSHILEELVKVCDRFAIIDKGEFIKEFSREDLLNMTEEVYDFTITDVDKAIYVLNTKFKEVTYRINGSNISVNIDKDKAVELNKEFVYEDVGVLGFNAKKVNIEEVFLKITGGENNVFYY